MTRFGWLVVLGIVFALALAAAIGVWVHKESYSPVVDIATSTAAVSDPASLSIYTSGEYGFSFFYPAAAAVTDAYTEKNSMREWRTGSSVGTSVVEVVNGAGMVRVGVSADKSEVAKCLQTGRIEESLPELVIGSTTWKRFAFDKLGTDDEARVVSYRVVHDASCYALEAFEPIQDAATSTAFSLDDIAGSFTFAD